MKIFWHTRLVFERAFFMIYFGKINLENMGFVYCFKNNKFKFKECRK